MRISRGVIIQSKFMESNAANITRLSWQVPPQHSLSPESMPSSHRSVSVTEQNLGRGCF